MFKHQQWMERRGMCPIEYVAKIKALIILSLVLAACSNSGTGGGRDQYTIQINVVGAALGAGKAALTVTETKSGQSLTFTGSEASQTLNHEFGSGDPYNLVIGNPKNPAQNCVLDSGSPSGQVSGDTTFNITCTVVPVQVTGSVIGLKGSGLELLFNGTPATASIGPTSDGSFSFKVPSGTTPQITVQTQPTTPAQSCVLSGASPPQAVSAAITGLTVTCTTASFTVFGNVTGLVGTGLRLTDGVPGSPTLSILPGAPGNSVPFQFSILSGATYTIAQVAPPTYPTQSCQPTSGPYNNITVGNSAPTGSVLITCTIATYPVSFTLAGTSGFGVQAALYVNDNLYSSLLVTCNTSTPSTRTSCSEYASGFAPLTYTFPLQVSSGSSYKVVVNAQNDPAQSCYVWNIGGIGTVIASAPQNATVVCANVPQYAFAPGNFLNSNSMTSTYTDGVFYYQINPATSTSPGNLVASGLDPIFTVSPTGSSVYREIFASVPGSVYGVDYVAQVSSSSPRTSSILQYKFSGVFGSSPATPTPTTIGSPLMGEVQDMQFDTAHGVLYICYLSTTSASPGLYLQTLDYSSEAVIGKPEQLIDVNGSGCSLHLAKTAVPGTAPQWMFAYYTNSVTLTYNVFGFSLAAVNSQTPPTAALASLPVATLLNLPNGNTVLNNVPPPVAIDPTGRFMYVPQYQYGNPPDCDQILPPLPLYFCFPSLTTIQGFAISQPTRGNPSGLVQIPAAAPRAFAYASNFLFEPSGHLVYVTDEDRLYPLAIDQKSGSLSYARQSPLSPSQQIELSYYASVDPSGTYIFLNRGNELLTYTVNPNDGSLYELPPLILSSQGIYGVPVIDPSGQFLYMAQDAYSATTGYQPTFVAYSITSAGLVPLAPPPAPLPSGSSYTNTFLILQ
jgi:hypothetical protein